MFHIVWDLLQESKLSDHSKTLDEQLGKLKRQQTALAGQQSALSAQSDKLGRQEARINVLEDRLFDLEMNVARFRKMTELLLEFIGERMDLDEDEVSTTFADDIASLFEDGNCDLGDDIVECLCCRKLTLRYMKACIHCHETNVRYKQIEDGELFKTVRGP